jgi:N-acetylglucosaminyl-diphospho-decaprenol L-rhamnosyltransferase
MQTIWTVTPVIIVSYRTPGDVAECLTSLDAMEAEPPFSVHICENGGAGAFDELCATLEQPEGPCTATADGPSFIEASFSRIRYFRLRQSNRRVLVGEAKANLGYAGGINTWLLPLLRYKGWRALWILNPDTAAAPGALQALAAHAQERNLAMVGSRILASPTATRIVNQGLRWRRWMCSALAVGWGLPASADPDPAAVEAQIHAANGSSLYVTRPCAEVLAPLDDRYFLYFEDLDWGMRARRAGFRIGYAHRSVVVHPGGRSIGSSSSECAGSPFAIYLEFRSSLQFARNHYPRWLAWATIMRGLQALRLLPKGRFWPAMRGLAAGLKGETGYPRIQLDRERTPKRV